MELLYKLKNILMIFIIIFIIIPILFVSSVILIDAYKNPYDVPSFFGWKPFIVLSNSMESVIESGDLIIVKEVNYNEVKKDDIIAFRTQDIVITHRVVGIDDKDGITSFITKGDNNIANDNFKITSDNIEGIYKFKLKGFGNIAIFLQSSEGMFICVCVPIFMFFIREYYEDFKYRKKEKDRQ